MQTYLESLTALHSAELQAQGSRKLGRTVRREPVTTEHPLVRTNPVTGWKSLFFNPGFVTKIVGVPKTESDHIISLLNEMVATSPEIHARFQWQAGDVALWDNRVTVCYIYLPNPFFLKTIPLSPSFLPSFFPSNLLSSPKSEKETNNGATYRITLHPTASLPTAVMPCAWLSGLNDRIWIRKARLKKTS